MGNKVSFTFIAHDQYTRITREAARVTATLKGKLRGLTGQMRKTEKASDSMRKSIGSKIGFAAMAAGVAIGVTAIVTAGSQFETSMADLSAITGATGKDFTNLKEKTMDMAAATITSQTDVAEAIKLVASAKPDLLDNIDALVATTKQVLVLKNAAGIGLADSANIVAQGLNIFGESADQASRYVNVLAAGAKLGSSEIADTGAAMLIAGPAARAAGLSFEQLNSAIQTTAKGGIKGAMAGTALNAILGRLQRAGIDFKKLGLEGAFQVVKNRMDSLGSSTERAQFAAKTFGEEHSKVGFALLDNIKSLGQYENSLAGTNIAQEQANIKNATFAKRLELINVLVKDKMIRIFEYARPTIDMLSGAMVSFVSGLDAGDIEVFGMAMSALGVTVTALVKILSAAFSILMAVLKPVMATLKGVGELIGQVAGAVATLDFSQFDLGGSFDIGGKFMGLFGGDEPATPAPTTSSNQTNVDVTIRAPEGAVEEVKTGRSGDFTDMNVGVNMAGAM